MIERLDIQPDDRILLLSIPEISLVFQLAKAAPRGLVVGLGGDAEVHSARAAARELDNVMFVPATPGEIPWQERFFSKVIDLRGGWAEPEKISREILRVLSPGGLVCLRNQDPAALVAAGLIEADPDEDFRVLKAGTSGA